MHEFLEFVVNKYPVLNRKGMLPCEVINMRCKKISRGIVDFVKDDISKFVLVAFKF